MTPSRSPSLWSRLWTLGETAIGALNALQPAAQLAARWFIAGVFFRSGLTKIADWETTVALFTDEYHVPLLSPDIAAALGTSAELALPVLILFGFAGRLAAAGLFILNIVAVISVEDMPIPALQQHVFWGSVLIGLLLWGPGRWSVDRYLWPWLRERVVGASSATSTAAASRAAARRI
jgi:putative oxidoreductase